VAELFGRDVEQHILAARIILSETLREITHGRSQFAIGTAELFEQRRPAPGWAR
jgi:hypothetical protein